MVLRWRAVTCTCKCLMHSFFTCYDSAAGLPPPVTLEFLMTGHEWVLGLNIFWNCTFRLSQQGHQYLSWQSLIFSLDGPLIRTVHIVVLQYSSFLFKANCVCSQKQVAKFITVIHVYVCFASQGRAYHCESLGTIPLVFDSLLYTLSKQLPMKYTVYQWKECHLLVINYNWYVFVCSVVFK